MSRSLQQDVRVHPAWIGVKYSPGETLLHRDARIYLSQIDANQEIAYEPGTGRSAWLQVLRGTVSLNGIHLETSDGAAVSDETTLMIRASADAEIMLFDLA